MLLEKDGESHIDRTSEQIKNTLNGERGKTNLKCTAKKDEANALDINSDTTTF